MPKVSNKRVLSNEQVLMYAQRLADLLRSTYASKLIVTAYAIPSGGIPAAYAVMAHFPGMRLTDDPRVADFFIDDLIDSGGTMQHWCDAYPGKPFFALVDKTAGECADEWVVFPWEKEASDKVDDDSIVGTLTNRLRESGVPFFANDNIADHISAIEYVHLRDEVI